PTIIAESFGGVLAPYAPCFQARSYRIFQWLVLGWVQCLERRTLTAVALASGAGGGRHFLVFHRFFARAQWGLDSLGEAVVEAGRARRCAVPADHGAAPPGRRGRPCRAGSMDQAGVARGDGRHRGRLGPDSAVLSGGGQCLRGADAPGAAAPQRARGESVAPG